MDRLKEGYCANTYCGNASAVGSDMCHPDACFIPDWEDDSIREWGETGIFLSTEEEDNDATTDEPS